MANWDRKYNTPAVGANYTVTVTCPAGWRPKSPNVRPTLTATRIGAVPNESYLTMYEKAGASAVTDDVWAIGALKNNGSPNMRFPTVSIEHTSTPPPYTPIHQDKPTIRDGAGAGAGGGTGFGSIDIDLSSIPTDVKSLKVMFSRIEIVPIKGPKPPVKGGKKTAKKK